MRKSFRTRALVSAGAIALAGATSLMVLAPAASAAAADVTVTNTPAFVQAATVDQAIGNIVLTESATGDIPAGTIHISLVGEPAGTKFVGSPTAALTSGVGITVTAAVAVTDDDLAITTTGVSTTKAVITVSGIKLTTGAGLGSVDATVGNAEDTTTYEAAKRIAFVGTTTRLAGSDRYATAEQIAEAQGCVGTGSVIIARGDNFPDALSASYLAGDQNVPILLVTSTTLPTVTTNALKNIGAKNVYVIGGTGAINDDVFNLIASKKQFTCPGGVQTADTLNVTRISGSDRYATAANVARAGATAGKVDKGVDGTACSQVKTAIVASGENFPDALAAGPLAYGGVKGSCGVGGPIPLLLTQKGALPATTANTISDLGIQQVILLGGTGAVDNTVKNAIDAISGVDDVVRVAGADRAATAVEINKILGNEALGDWDEGNVFIARGDNFPDALAAAPFAAENEAPLYLAATTSSLGTTSATGISAYPNPVFFTDATLLGGTGALTEAVATQVGAAMAAQAN